MKVALLQINPTVGDLSGNARLIADAVRLAGARGADLAVTPELALVGYLPRDLLLSAGFIRRSWDQLHELARDSMLPAGVVGRSRILPTRDGPCSTRRRSPTAAPRSALSQSAPAHYDVFDEDRYFEPFHGAQVLTLGGRRLGISICEDVWNDRDFWKRRRYHHDPIEELVRAGADAIVNMSASPFTAGKHRRREEMLGSMALKYRVPLAYVNQFGVIDAPVFDGRVRFSARARRSPRARSFDADYCLRHGQCAGRSRAADLVMIGGWRALVLGRATTPASALLAGGHRTLSGIDSARTAGHRVEALGPIRCSASHAVAIFEPRKHRPIRCSGGQPRHPTLALPSNESWRPWIAPRGEFADARDVTGRELQSRIRATC